MPLGFTFRRWATKEDKGADRLGSHLAKAGSARSVHSVLQVSGLAELTMFLCDYYCAIGHIKNKVRRSRRP